MGSILAPRLIWRAYGSRFTVAARVQGLYDAEGFGYESNTGPAVDKGLFVHLLEYRAAAFNLLEFRIGCALDLKP